MFKAYKDIDYWGAATDREFSYFWLAVSARGVWEEVPHKILKQPEYSRADSRESREKDERRQQEFWKTSKFHDDEFAGGVDWSRPPKSLLPLIRKYDFKPQSDFNMNKGQGTVTWSSKGLCLNGKCTKTVVSQRTLGNKFSSEAYADIEVRGEKVIEIEFPAIKNVFYHAGVALFKNGNYKIVDGRYEATDDNPTGAMFDFNKTKMGEQLIDYNYIDAISIVPDSIASKRGN